MSHEALLVSLILVSSALRQTCILYIWLTPGGCYTPGTVIILSSPRYIKLVARLSSDPRH